jgi:hypothetical protein
MKMNWKKIQMVARILKALQPVIWDIVDDIVDAKSKDSEGGSKITKEERQTIVLDNILDIPMIIETIVNEL